VSAASRHVVPAGGGHVALVLHLPAATPAPCVVACHGLSASKDSDKYLLLGTALPAAGLALARFDFRGCGEASGREDETTIATRIEDAEAVLAFLARERALDGRVGLLGSSLGGFVALWVALGRALPVVTWNAPATLAGLAAAPPEERPGVGDALRREFEEGRFAEAPKGVARHLVIHGAADDVVPVAHGRRLRERAAEPADLLVLPGADHRLTDPGHRARAVEASRAWLARFLREGRSA
jgi:dipeptidyl aminopeptidase/acylaminoacyl peptidase